MASDSYNLSLLDASLWSLDLPFLALWERRMRGHLDEIAPLWSKILEKNDKKSPS